MEVRYGICPPCMEEFKPGEELVYSGETPAYKRCYEAKTQKAPPAKDVPNVSR